ncbi:hypothetical protein CERSUDRAFT_159133 [Gelatoporia subvermispora B]|uniref:G domain-containing protein n=1 Tax=Ceriporiopsis subvermispora (strain B) TaxID=914234 RepID=M2R6M0_CERS8|nr:hypothetical protein CERSUDRAFT_159133 [Gelatoporia subvermispora B]
MVMGPTGSGKTSFINHASGSQLRTNSGLMSCTDQIQIAGPFTLDEYSITLVDTPGFNDTVRSDAQILGLISDFVVAEYERGYRFTGILYFHRISDNRIGGAALRNFRFFRALCGNHALKSSAIVTNMWGEVSKEVGREREEELMRKDILFKPALDAGARLYRHEFNPESAHEILRRVIKNRPCTLLLQQEIVEQGKHISATAAGVAFLGELALVQQKYQDQLRELLKEIDEAIANHDEDDRVELEDGLQRLEAQEERRKAEERLIRDAPRYHTLEAGSWGPSLIFSVFAVSADFVWSAVSAFFRAAWLTLRGFCQDVGKRLTGA